MDPSPIPLSYQPHSPQPRRFSLGILGLIASLTAVVCTSADFLIGLFPPETQATTFWNGLAFGLALASIPAATMAAFIAPLALYRNRKRLEIIAFILTVIYWSVVAFGPY
jgi:hypothetical protein